VIKKKDSTGVLINDKDRRRDDVLQLVMRLRLVDGWRRMEER
jgi:hypothetical protein